MKSKRKFKIGSLVLTFVSIAIALVMILPIVWGFFCSLQHEGKQIKTIWDWFTPPYTLGNYPNLIANSEVLVWLINSLVVALITMVLTVLITTMAAYALAKIPFKGRHAFYMYFLLGMLIPTEATVVPLFILVKDLGLTDSYAGLIFPTIANAMMLIVTVDFFKSVPDSIIEAVRIDGGSEFTIFWRIMLPLSKPIIATVCLFSFVNSWNNYLWPLLCIFSDKLYTMPIGIPTLLNTESPDFVVPMTANMISSLPMIIMFIIFERQVVEGISTQGLKE